MRKRTKRILFATAVAGAGSLAFVNSSAGKKIVSKIKQQISSSQKQPVLETFIPPKSRSVSLDTNDDGAGVLPFNERNAYIQTDAATKIQRVTRGHLARKQVEAERKLNMQKTDAATKLQRVTRGHLARKQVQAERKLNMQKTDAATKIQSLARGHLARQRVRPEIELRRQDARALKTLSQDLVKSPYYNERTTGHMEDSFSDIRVRSRPITNNIIDLIQETRALAQSMSRPPPRRKWNVQGTSGVKLTGR